MKISRIVITFLFLHFGVSYSQVKRIDTFYRGGQGMKDTTITYVKDSCFWIPKYCKLNENLPNGEYYIFMNDTLSYKAFYNFGQKDSNWIYYHPNGYIFRIVPYRNGKIHGVEKVYEKDGNLLTESNYLFGKLNGQSIFFSKSKIRAISIYEEDTIQKSETYFTNGKLKSVKNFKNGKSHGMDIEYYENGKISQIEYYELGKRVRFIVYDKLGKVKSDKKY